MQGRNSLMLEAGSKVRIYKGDVWKSTSIEGNGDGIQETINVI